jgi:hypothetical protein
VNVEHEEVLLIPRWVDCNRVTFKYGPRGRLHRLAEDVRLPRLDSKEKIRVGQVEVAPRDVWPPCCRTRPSSATSCTARRAPARGSRAPTTASRARSTCTTWPTTPRRCGSTATRRSSGRRGQPRRGPRTAGRGDVDGHGRARAGGVRRRPYLNLLAAYGTHHGMVEMGEGYWPGPCGGRRPGRAGATRRAAARSPRPARWGSRGARTGPSPGRRPARGLVMAVRMAR